MTEVKHTPGPWATYVNKENDVVIRKMLPDGMECCEIARVKTGFSDARLIASATELLDALLAAKNTLVAFKFQPGDVNCWEPHDEENLALVDAAIAKATGN